MKIKELKNSINLSTGKFVLFSIITGGIYPILWINKYSELIKETFEIEEHNFPKNFDFYLAICVGLDYQFSIYSIYIPILGLLSSLCGLGSAILYILWAFKIKNGILNYVNSKLNLNYKMNSFYTFLFTVFYINYCINELGEIDEKNS